MGLSVELLAAVICALGALLCVVTNCLVRVHLKRRDTKTGSTDMLLTALGHVDSKDTLSSSGA